MANRIDCFIPWQSDEQVKGTLDELLADENVKEVNFLREEGIGSTKTIRFIAETATAPYTLLYCKYDALQLGYHALTRLLTIAEDSQALMLFSDHYTLTPNGERRSMPLISCQLGSVRDDFQMGSVLLFRTEVLKEYVAQENLHNYQFAALYDLRLFISRKQLPLHIDEFLYTEVERDTRLSGQKQFDYVDPRNRSRQIEMERACTRHLRALNAYLHGDEYDEINLSEGEFAVEASVIIPVRNRERTIRDAIRSVLEQETTFPFNLIVVDNGSADGTTEAIDEFSADERVIHIIPDRNDLGIGGCWNMAVHHPQVGRFVVQLDSDDLYSSPQTLQRMVDAFYAEGAAMVIGSYRMCDFQLNTLPPGLIDHREWTLLNGRNNALRINGLGAPRAFFTPVLRELQIPNTSYGEDYALGLMISRRYRIGRIYDELYLCRRWDGNSDAVLSPEKVNANNAYKDGLRTIELLDRRNLNDYWNTSATPQMANDLFDSQLSAWKEVADRYAQLKNVLTSDFMVEECRVAAQFNPARIGSTGAKVDAKTISERPCFLCELNRPEEQQQCAIVKRYHLLVNPYPILPRHFTIAKMHHSPQAIYDNYVDMMRITEGLGDDMVVFYNGPLCGASAPDHMHFQAGSRGVVPLERDWDSKYRRIRSRLYPISESEYLEMNSYENMADNTGIFSLRGYVCPGIIVITRTPEANDILFKKIYDSLPVPEGSWEPMMNILAWKEASSIDGSPRIVSVIFPRAKHRPECYFASGTEQILVSPGALDMGGLLITPRKEDFLKLTPKKVTSIIQECAMSLDDEQEMIMKLKNARI